MYYDIDVKTFFLMARYRSPALRQEGGLKCVLLQFSKKHKCFSSAPHWSIMLLPGVRASEHVKLRTSNCKMRAEWIPKRKRSCRGLTQYKDFRERFIFTIQRSPDYLVKRAMNSTPTYVGLVLAISMSAISAKAQTRGQTLSELRIAEPAGQAG